MALTWKQPLTTGPLPLTYEVSSSFDSGAFTPVATTTALSTTAACAGVATCAYAVRATNSDGPGPAATVTVTVTPGPVLSLLAHNAATIFASGDTTMQLTWQRPKKGAAPDTYEIQRCTIAPYKTGGKTDPVKPVETANSKGNTSGTNTQNIAGAAPKPQTTGK